MKKILLASFASVSLLTGATSFAPMAQAQAQVQVTACAITTVQASAFTQLIRSAPSLDQQIFVTFMTGFSSGCITTPQASAFTGLVRSSPNVDQRVFVDFLTSFTSDTSTTSTSRGPTITITSPNDGAYWYPGTAQSVTWSTTGIHVSEQVLIRLRSASSGYSGQEYYLITEGNVGSSSFVVPTNFPVGPYYVEVKTSVNGISYMDSSDQYIKILSVNCTTNPTDPSCNTLYLCNGVVTHEPCPSSPTITITSPNGGERWEIGQLNTITWAPYSYNQYGEPDINPARDVDVYLETINGSRSAKVMDTGKASLHTYFNLFNYTNFASPGTYYVRVVNRVTGATDRSDALFTLLPRSVDVRVNDSDGPISLSDNQPISVMVRTNNVTSCTISGARNTIGGNYSNLSMSMNVPANMYAFAPSGGGSTSIYVTCYKSDGSIRSDSVQVNIASASASLRVVSPNGGESIVASDTTQVKIAWRMDGITTPISIALYKNDKWLFWIEKALYLDKSDGTYSYVWTPNAKGPALPNFSAEGNSGYKIYITGQKADGTGYVDDKSDASFGFVASPTPTTPTLTLSVNPSSVVLNGSTTLTWSATSVDSCDFSHAGQYGPINRATSGSLLIKPVTNSIYYGMTCKGPNGSVDKQILVTVTVPPIVVDNTVPSAPSSLKVVNPRIGTGGAAATLSWGVATDNVGVTGYIVKRRSPNPATLGTVTGTTLELNGLIVSVAPTLLNEYTYEVQAKDARGNLGPARVLKLKLVFMGIGLYVVEVISNTIDTTVQKVIALVTTVAAPTLTVTANPATITLGQSSTISWSSTNATSCSSERFSGVLSTSGSRSASYVDIGANVNPITCTGPGGSVTKSVSVTVNPVAVIAELHMIDIYQASGPSGFCYSTPGQASVRVRNTGKPIILALSSYEPVKWNITLDTGANLKQVILGGYHAQTVSGIPSIIPVTSYSFYSLDRVSKGVDSGNGFFHDSRNSNSQYYAWASEPTMCPESAAIPIANRVVFNGGSYYSGAAWKTKLIAVTGLSGVTASQTSGTSFTVPAIVTAYNPTNSTQMASVIEAFGTESAPIYGTATPMQNWGYTWTRNLEIGSGYTNDVIALQTALTKEVVYSGEITGGFYTQTYLGVKALQAKYGIESTGFVGPVTLAKLNELY